MAGGGEQKVLGRDGSRPLGRFIDADVDLLAQIVQFIFPRPGPTQVPGQRRLVPLVLRAASGRRQSISVFGCDYDTPDGTCVRDYIHVNDLCDAHLLALRSLWDGGGSAAYNLGNGSGFSVREVIDTAAGVTGRDIAVVEAERRAGDPGTLVADSTLAQAELGWRPQYADLATIVEHAWRWEQALASAER